MCCVQIAIAPKSFYPYIPKSESVDQLYAPGFPLVAPAGGERDNVHTQGI